MNPSTERPLRLGVLTPSSNTALEPLTSAMVGSLPGVSAHFSRFTVTEISMRDQSLNQFDDSKILEAARLLADAHVDVICWSGTSASWLGELRLNSLPAAFRAFFCSFFISAWASLSSPASTLRSTLMPSRSMPASTGISGPSRSS